MIGTSTGEQYEDEFAYAIGETTDVASATQSGSSRPSGTRNTPRTREIQDFNNRLPTGIMPDFAPLDNENQYAPDPEGRDRPVIRTEVLEQDQIPITAQQTSSDVLPPDVLEAQANQQLADFQPLSDIYRQEAQEAARAAGLDLSPQGGGGGWGREDPHFGRSFWDNLVGKTGPRYVTWPENVVRESVKALLAPGRILAGEEKPTVEAAMGFAGLMVFAPAPVVRGAVDGTLGAMAGVSAKTANKQMLTKAQEMAMIAKDPDEIWRATGWYKGYDDRWRFEIPSKEAKLKYNPSGIETSGNTVKISPVDNAGTLNGLLDFPGLYKAYPELETIKMSYIFDTKANWSAMYFPPQKGNFGRNNSGSIELNLGNPLMRSKENVVRTVLHEVQHAIQEKEKFTFKGTNPDFAFNEAASAIIKRGKEIQAEFKAGKMTEEQTLALFKELKQLADDMVKVQKDFGMHLYRREPGEIEARLAALRRSFGYDESWLNSPAQMQRELGRLDVEYSPFAVPK